MTYILDSLRSQRITNRAQLDEYYASNCLGHTKIVNFETYGPTSLRKDFTLPCTDAMIFGSIVDTLLTRSDNFLEEYYIPSQNIKPTASETPFINYLVDNEINPYSLTDDVLSSILDTCKTYTIYTKSIDKRLEKARKLFPLVKEILDNKHKKVITQEQFSDALNCINALKTSDITRPIFENPSQVVYQVQMIGNGGYTHALFDLIYVDIENKIIHPIDLKCTSYPEREFISHSFYKFKYYRQAELYMSILKDNLYSYLYDDGWKIAPFKFMVVCKNTLSPMLYEFPIVYEDGRLKISDKTTVEGLDQVLSDINWHLQNKQFMYDKETYIQLFKQSSKKEKKLIVKPIFDSQLSEEDKLTPIVIHKKSKLKLGDYLTTSMIDGMPNMVFYNAPAEFFTVSAAEDSNNNEN